MSLELVTQKFNKARQNNPDLSKRLISPIPLETFRQITQPIAQHLSDDPVYGAYDLSVFRLVEDSRQMCANAQAARSLPDDKIKEDYRLMLNALQGIAEATKDTELTGGDTVYVDYEDHYYLAFKSDAIRHAASIHQESFHNTSMHETLNRFADNIDRAQARNWEPKVQESSTRLSLRDAHMKQAQNAPHFDNTIQNVAKPIEHSHVDGAFTENDKAYDHRDIA